MIYSAKEAKIGFPHQSRTLKNVEKEIQERQEHLNQLRSQKDQCGLSTTSTKRDRSLSKTRSGEQVARQVVETKRRERLVEWNHMINSSSVGGSDYENKRIVQETRATKQKSTKEPEEYWDVEPDCPPRPPPLGGTVGFDISRQ